MKKIIISLKLRWIKYWYLSGRFMRWARFKSKTRDNVQFKFNKLLYGKELAVAKMAKEPIKTALLETAVELKRDAQQAARQNNNFKKFH